jgi:cyclin B
MDQLAACENAAPEKVQVPVVPTAILGDATNTYCSGLALGQLTAGMPCPSKSSLVAEPIVSSSLSEGEMDGLALHADDPQHVAEYAVDVFQVLRREEPLHLPSPSYMDRQVHVNAKMRAILIDWLVDVHKKYKLRPETLFLAVHLIDRYLEIQVTAQRQLQLVGVTSLMIAAKFEEVYPPQIKDFVYVTDKAYSREDILKMEVSILRALQFKICRPTAMHFLERYQNVNGCTDAHRDLAQYLLELTLVEYKMLKYAPSHLAAAAILLSNKLLRRPSWTPAAVRHTKMTEPMLKDCAKEMCVILESAENNQLQAVRKKFSQLKHHSVAKLNFMPAPNSLTGTTVVSARERRGSLTGAGRRSSTGGAMELA